ncbi:MAG: FAD-dependent oxidoreductase [bacterium]
MIKNGKVGAVMVIGGGIGGIQASLDLAESGYKVYVVESKPSIGGVMPQLDKTFPTNDCSMCILSPKLVDCGRHKDIELITYADVVSVDGEPGNFRVRVRKRPRYVDAQKCNGCGHCAEQCTVELESEFNFGIDNRKAIYVPFPQAVPNVYTIVKKGTPPCKLHCPAGINIQGFIALIRARKYREALDLIRETIPLPAVCGRICPHPCEDECRRGEVDTPVSICALKRFAFDYGSQAPEKLDDSNGETKKEIETQTLAEERKANETQKESETHEEIETQKVSETQQANQTQKGTKTSHTNTIREKRKEKVAIIGSGPAGLAAAYDLALLGYPVTVFESLPVAGGMLAVGIPEYRLPKDVLEQEIAFIQEAGVEIRTNSPIKGDKDLKALSKDYQAIFLATGAHRGLKLGIPGEDDFQGITDAVTFLRKVALKEKIAIGKRVIVIGGGNAAIDSARTALRMGSEVQILYRRSRAEMPAYEWEIEEAEKEGVKIHYLAAPKKILGRNGKVTGIECVKMRLGEPDSSGRRRPIPIEGSEFAIEADTVIPSVSQAPALTFLGERHGFEISERGTLVVDEETLATNKPGIFAGGDAATGPRTAIEAIAAGKKAAIFMDRYIRGVDLKEGRAVEQTPVDTSQLARLLKGMEQVGRQETLQIPIKERLAGFREVDRGFDEETAVRESERCLNCGGCSECRVCETACEADAILHDQKEEEVEIEVGAILLAPGYHIFDPTLRPQYGYGRFPNVLTSLEYERILSASGPFHGHVVRPFDRREPKKIAFIQCVGSREEEHNYCSSVCCMYATKEAVITREHAPDTEITIFYMDMRAFGKEFDKYIDRAENEYGIRYVRCRITEIDEIPANRDLTIRYETEDGELMEDEFNMVILSVGLNPPEHIRDLKERLGIELNQHGFIKTLPWTPEETSMPGIYVCGASCEPKDIPETVTQASGAAAKASALLSSARGTLLTEKVYPEEMDVTDQPPRVGVFICNCGINIGGVVRVPEVVEYARTLPDVAYAEENLYTCSQDTQDKIKQKIDEYHINRVVVASCTPRTHESLFRDTIREAGLNPYLFELANIRDQCSWVHMHEPGKATEKAKALVSMAVAKASLLKPLHTSSIEVEPRALVIGGGLSGITASLSLADQGYEVHLVEREKELGGNLRTIHYTLEGLDAQDLLKDTIRRVESNDRIHIHTDARIQEVSGYVGNFRTIIKTGNGNNKDASGSIEEIAHGVIIVATGAKENVPKEYLYGKDERVITQSELEKRISEKRPEIRDLKTLVMIQCVGSRDEEHPYCSRICCSHALKNGLKLKEQNPKAHIFVFYRDVRTYGFKEAYYKEAREKGITFIRYDQDAKPHVSTKDGRLFVKAMEPILHREVGIAPDLLVLSPGIIPNHNQDLAQILKVPLTGDHFFLEAHVKLRPIDFAADGIFLCGLAHSPRFIEESISQANGVSQRAATILSKDHLESQGTVVYVNERWCTGCGTCVAVCPYDAREIDVTTGIARIKEVLCQGCGACAVACPSGATQQKGFEKRQILCMVDAATG